ncbi:ribonuclease P protein subunit p25-like protein [Stylophora pistillata]|uniref:Ribonuclease P protein subunit p25-like protein n=1 Tax=Stylophora pistillata TaxID=50429 RepID=A0A2B4SIZ2_STYPI|nr:ribonuclease P protein subunit p25-like protein [Stylophora pistillata]PFX28415.1 Ribonuclease P protein subunit p25-like protein [Stylophora pistillata]
MEHYAKVSSHSSESKEEKETCDIHVKSGSKIRNIISQAFRLLQNKKGEKVVLIGSGPTVTKTITCAEIIKRKSKGLHQVNKLFYSRIQDTWESKEDHLDKLQVTRKIPSISITLSKIPLDASQPGYQAPGKSKSPVQFGDKDWELAWEENQDDSRTSVQKTHPEKGPREKTNRTASKIKTETKASPAEPSKRVKSSEMATSKRQRRNRSRESTEEESKGGGTESEKMENTSLVRDANKNE